MSTCTLRLESGIISSFGSSSLVFRPARSARKGLSHDRSITITSRGSTCCDWLEVGMSPYVNDLEHLSHSVSEEPWSLESYHAPRPMGANGVGSVSHLAAAP